MYKLCKTEQSARRQRELEQGLLKAMSTCHYDEISVSDLCDQLNIPRKSFYRYFSGKDGALHALIDHTLLEFETFTDPAEWGSAETPYKSLERLFLFWKAQKPLLDALERSGISGVLVTRAIDHAFADVGLQNRFLRQEEKTTREQATVFSVCGLMTMVLNWHHSGYRQPAREIAQIALQLLTKPLFTEGDFVK